MTQTDTKWAALWVAAQLALACSSSRTPPSNTDASNLDAMTDAQTDASIDSQTEASADAARTDAQASDASARPLCDEPQQTFYQCGPSACDGPLLWQWNGTKCISVSCNHECTGSDCLNTNYPAYPSEIECAFAYSTCDASLCQDTGGRWDFESCGNYQCGRKPLCEAVIPGCDCGPHKVFRDGQGCLEDLNQCPFTAAPVLSPELLCGQTNGTWEHRCSPNYLCGTLIGECDGPANTYACKCPLGQEWDETRGCRVVSRCQRLEQGEPCYPTGNPLGGCRQGLVCESGRCRPNLCEQ